MGYPANTTARPGPRARGKEERAEALTGDRPGAPGKMAITREDAAKLGAIKLRAAKVTAAPTAADFNALVDDIRTVAAILNGMGANLTWL